MASEVSEIKAEFNEAKKNLEHTLVVPGNQASKDKMNFFLTQMDTINSRLESLEKTVEIGIPLVEAESGLARLSNLERAIQDNTSKMNLIATNIRDIKRELDLVKKEIRGGISTAAVDNLKTRVNYLENLIKQYSGSKTHKILMELVDIVQGLDKHVSNIENFIDRDLQQYLDLKGITPQQLQKTEGTMQAEQQTPKQGFFDGIIQSIKNIFKK